MTLQDARDAARIFREGGREALAAWVYEPHSRREQRARKDAAFIYMYGTPARTVAMP